MRPSEYGVRTIGDLAALPEDLLERRFGKVGPMIGERARGLDADTVSDCDPQGRSATSTRSTSIRRIQRIELIAARPVRGSRRPPAGLRRQGRDGICEDPRLVVPDDHAAADVEGAGKPTGRNSIFRTALELARPEVRGKRIRLLGVTASGLGEWERSSLFEDDDPRRRRVVEAEDVVRQAGSATGRSHERARSRRDCPRRSSATR